MSIGQNVGFSPIEKPDWASKPAPRSHPVVTLFSGRMRRFTLDPGGQSGASTAAAMYARAHHAPDLSRQKLSTSAARLRVNWFAGMDFVSPAA